MADCDLVSTVYHKGMSGWISLEYILCHQGMICWTSIDERVKYSPTLLQAPLIPSFILSCQIYTMTAHTT